LLGATPAASFSFAASEVLRRHKFKIHRASIRRFALAHDLLPPRTAPTIRASIRRWQREQIGSLWQLDATPHRWLPGQQQHTPLLNMLDDCSRLNVGATLYPAETLLTYLDFLPCAFQRYGLPLQLYVDYHSFFFTAVPESLTQLAAALRFYDMSFRYAPTPQAKGKIERCHQVWQQRLPAVFSAEGISDLAAANTLLEQLRHHRNHHEPHRELDMTPARAWKLARDQQRNVLRPVPNCPWWPYIWSIRTNARVDDSGCVSVGTQRLRVALPRGSKVVRCQHPDGSWSVLKHPPDKAARPVLLLRLDP
jgi:transposase InsO family protein